MAVKFSQFTGSGVGSNIYFAGYNSALGTNVKVSYTDLAASISPGTGTTNYVSKWTSSTALGNSLIQDDGTKVIINSSTLIGDTSNPINPSTTLNIVAYGNTSAGIVKVKAATTGQSSGILLEGGSNPAFISFRSSPYGNGDFQIGTNPWTTGSGNYDAYFSNANGIAGWIFYSTKNWAIGGSTDSGYRLDVSGTFRSTLDANINGLTVGKGGGQLATNTAIGYQAQNATNTGGYNVAIGYQALLNNTADANVAIGYFALKANVGANTNTAIGTNAGAANTSGTKQVFIGYNAGAANTTSSGNTYVGSYSGVSATGNLNTAVGAESAYNLTTGSQSVFIGNASGRATNTGSTNTFVGYFSGYGVTSGSENVLIGNSIMTLSTTAQQNTIVGAYAGNVLNGNANCYFGWYAGVSATTSTSNVGIGYGALQNITTGSNNTSLGYRAGRFYGASTSSNTTGANGIFIGYLTRASADGNTNETVIGYDVVGNGSNSVTLGNSSVTKTVLQSGVLVGTSTSAGYAFDVNGTARINNGGDSYYALTVGNSSIANGRILLSSNSIQDIIASSGNQRIRFQSGIIEIGMGTSGTQGIRFGVAGSATSIQIYPNGAMEIGNTGVQPVSAALQVNSTTQGFLPPRMTGLQAEAIASPAAGLLVYSTDGSGTTITSSGWWGRTATTWVKLN